MLENAEDRKNQLNEEAVWLVGKADEAKENCSRDEEAREDVDNVK